MDFGGPGQPTVDTKGETYILCLIIGQQLLTADESREVAYALRMTCKYPIFLKK